MKKFLIAMLAVVMLFGSVAVMGITVSAQEPFSGAKTVVIDKYNYCLISAENPVGLLKIVPDETSFYEIKGYPDDGDTIAALVDNFPSNEEVANKKIICEINDYEAGTKTTLTFNIEISHDYKPDSSLDCRYYGIMAVTCVCGAETEIYGRPDHKPVTLDPVEATCSTNGTSGDTVCEVCGVIVEAGKVIPKSEHTPGKSVKENEKAATCTKAGKYNESVYCTVCNEKIDSKTVDIPATGHTDKNKDGKCDTCGVVTDSSLTNPCKDAKINIAAAKTVDYKSKVTIKDTATGVPKDYSLAIYVNGKQVAKGTNTEVTYEAGQATSDISYTVKVIDAKGNVQKDSANKDLAKDGGKITINAGFFAKIIAFFKGLFGALHSVTIKP